MTSGHKSLMGLEPNMENAHGRSAGLNNSSEGEATGAYAASAAQPEGVPQGWVVGLIGGGVARAYAAKCQQPGHRGKKGWHVSTAPQGRGWTAPERRGGGGKEREEGRERRGRGGGGGESQRTHEDQQ